MNVSVSTYQSNSLNRDLQKFLESVAEVVKDYVKNHALPQPDLRLLLKYIFLLSPH